MKISGKFFELKINTNGRQIVDEPKIMADLTVLENDNSKLNTKKGIVCIRGLGDFYTKRYLYIDYPIECNKFPKITITHDPAGAFENNVSGFIIAGHTHCGQISLPLFGPIWVPTEAPPSAHCGLYKDDKKTL